MNVLAQARQDGELITCQLGPGKAESLHARHPPLSQLSIKEKRAFSSTVATNVRGTEPRFGRPKGGSSTRCLRPPLDAGTAAGHWPHTRTHQHGTPRHKQARPPAQARCQRAKFPSRGQAGLVSATSPHGPRRARPLASDTPADG